VEQSPTTRHIGLRVEPDLAAAFERIAASEERTLSAELRRLMRQRVEEADPGQRPKGGP
jgi:hypothetical protein